MKSDQPSAITRITRVSDIAALANDLMVILSPNGSEDLHAFLPTSHAIKRTKNTGTNPHKKVPILLFLRDAQYLPSLHGLIDPEFNSSITFLAPLSAVMFPSFLSIVSVYGSYLRRCFITAGLSSQKIDVDDQTTLHFWGPRKEAARKKPSLVLIHGFGPMAIWQWRQQVQFLAPHFDVYVPDLVFFGDSTTKSSERSEVFQAASVAKLLDKLDVKRFYVMGTSYGGFVAYHLAKMLGERVEKVVIASSGVNMRKSDNAALMERAKLDKIEDLMLPATPKQLRNLMGLSVSKRLNMVPSFFLNDIINNLYSENRKEKMELLKGLTLGRDDAVNLSPLQQEVLIIWGEHDQIFPVQMANELKQVIGKKARLELIKNASHVPQIEKAGEFNKIVLDFLRGS